MAGGKLSIRPASNSRRFDKIKDTTTGMVVAAITDYTIEGKDKEGIARSIDRGQFTGERFPDSKQGTRPYYDDGKKKFILKKEDGTEYTQEDLNERVKEISVLYPKHHRQGGMRIDRADIKDFDDAFVNHIDLVVRTDEGSVVIDLDTPIGQFQGDILRGNPKFKDENIDGYRSLETEYMIHHPELSEDREEKAREQDELAMELYGALNTNPRKMIAILRLFGRDWSKDTSTKKLRNEIYKYVKDNVNGDKGQSFQKLFVHYAQLPQDKLDVQELVMMGTLYSEINFRGGVYMMQGLPLGSTFNSLIEFFSSPANSAQTDALKIKLGDKL